MIEPRQTAIADMETLIKAGRRCADQIEAALHQYEGVLERLKDGMEIRDALSYGRVADTRRDVTDVMEEFQATRRASRVSLMRADIASGSSPKAVSETWGVSRQLVHRYVSGEDE
jgi:hypothetical protein